MRFQNWSAQSTQMAQIKKRRDADNLIPVWYQRDLVKENYKEITKWE
jgi:hypothetical protein